MNILEKTINEVVGPGTTKKNGWLYENMPEILKVVNQAFTRITEKGKSEGYECDE